MEPVEGQMGNVGLGKARKATTMTPRISFVMTLVVFAAFAAARADECVIKAVEAASVETSAIGYSGKGPRVVVVQLTLENAGGEPITLNWKNAVPVLQAEGRRVEASRILVPNWLPMAGGVGPYATETCFGGEEIKGFLEIDKDTWCGWLAIDKPGAESGDHISIPVKSATFTVTKETTSKIKLLFPEDIPLSSAQIVVPRCNPSPFPLSESSAASAPASAHDSAGANERFCIKEIMPQSAGKEGRDTRVFVKGTDQPLVGTFYRKGAAYRLAVAIRAKPFNPFVSRTAGTAEPAVWYAGAVHLYEGRVINPICTIEGDPNYPLTFKLVEDVGYVWVCGAGTVTTKEGKSFALGRQDSVEGWILKLKSEDPLDREGATQALGYLARTDDEKNRVVSALIESLKDTAMEVRRNAAESLGRIGDPRAIEPLRISTEKEKEGEEWVREVAEEAVKTITEKRK